MQPLQEMLVKISEDVQETGRSRFDILPDRNGVLVTQNRALPAQYGLALAQLEELIAKFGKIRAELLPAVEAAWPGGTMVIAQPNPSVSLERCTMTGDPLIHIRDPRFGWLHYLVGRDVARKLGEQLLALADAPPPPVAGNA